MGIIDVVLIGLIVVALVIGIYKGFAGVMLGFLGTLIIAVALTVAVPLITLNVMYADKEQGVVVESEDLGYSEPFYKLYSLVEPKFVGADTAMLTATYVENGDSLGVEITDEDGNVQVVSLSDYLLAGLGDVPYAQYVSGVAGVVNYLTKFGAVGLTVGHSIAAFVTFLAFGAILWFVGFLVLIIGKLVLKHFVFRALDSNGTASKIDRAIGAVFTVALVVVVAWAAFSFVDNNKLSWGIADGVDEWIGKNQSLALMSQNNLFSMLSGKSAETPSSEDVEQVVSRVFVLPKLG